MIDNNYGVQQYAEEARTAQPNDYASSALSQGRGLLNSGGNDSGLAYGDQATLSAIKSKYNKQYGLQEGRIKIDAANDADQDYIKKLHIASDMASKEHEMNFQKAMMAKKQKQAQNALRGQIIGSVLGIAGGVAGGMATGGSGVGILAGAQLGQSAGQAAGSF